MDTLVCPFAIHYTGAMHRSSQSRIQASGAALVLVR